MPQQNAGAQPSPILSKGVGGAAGISTIPGAPAQAGTNPAQTNPFAPNAPNLGLNTTSGAQIAQSSDPNQNLLQKQLVDIYGKGVGGELTGLLTSMQGTDSAALQSYIASLQPQEAKAQASTNATLGAQGVSGNSSVAAIADSNLQAQETAAIAGESAQLQTHQEDLTASILSGTQQSAQKEVASSGWQVFGDVLNSLGQDAAKVVPAFLG
jgi:hypothetical protein